MSVLTWRDVSQPDFGPASSAAANATAAMNNAFAGINSTIQGYKDVRSDAADRAIQLRALTYQDPASMQAALANGQIVGPDAKYARTGFLAGLNDQTGNLIKNALTSAQTGQAVANTGLIDADTSHTQGLSDHLRFTNAEEIDRKANIDANAPIINQAQLLAANKDYVGATALLRTSTLKPEEQQSVLAGLNTNVVNADSISKTQFDQAKEVKNQQDSLAADAVYKKITGPGGAPNPQTARAQMLDASTSMNPEAYQLLVQRLKPLYGDIEQNPLNGLSLTTTGIPGAGVSNLDQYSRKTYDTTFAYGKDGWDPAQHSIQDVLNYQRDVMIPANKGRVGAGDKGSGGIGAYQQTYETLGNYAKKVFGEQDLSKVQFTPQVQEKLAEAQFNEVKNNPKGDLKAIWPSLTTEEATQLKGMSWDQAAPYISAGETGSKTAAGITLAMQNRLRVFDVNNVISSNIAKQSANGFIKDYNDAANDATNANDPGAVALNLIKGKMELGKANVDNLRQYVSDVMARAGVTAPIAGAIVANSLEGKGLTDHFFSRRLYKDGVTGAPLNGGYEVNRDVLANNMKLANTEEIKHGASSLNFAKESKTRLADAQSRFDAAKGELVKVAVAQAASPDDPQLKAGLAQATTVYNDTYAAVNGIQNNVLNADAQAVAAKQPVAEKVDRTLDSAIHPTNTPYKVMSSNGNADTYRNLPNGGRELLLPNGRWVSAN